MGNYPKKAFRVRGGDGLGSEVVALLYKSIWVAGLLLAGGLGLVGAASSLPPIGMVAIAIVGALVGWALDAWIGGERSRFRGRPTVVAGCAFAGLSFCGGVAALGFLPAAGIGLLLCALSPKTVRWLLIHICPPDEVHSPIHGQSVEDMSDANLCLAWRQSYVTMNNCRTPSQRGRVAAQRQSYLDELEQRHPAEFACWLYGEASPTNDPGHYLDFAD